MINKNELVFVNKILNAEIPIRRAAKQLGLRRDDLIKRIREMLGNDEENLWKLNLVIIVNKMLFDNLSMKQAATMLEVSEAELDRKIVLLLENNELKKKRYQEYKILKGVC